MMDQISNEHHNYWTSVGLGGVIFGFLLFLISLLGGYAAINSEPTGAYFSPYQIIWTFACLVGAFGGLFAIWHYTQTKNETVTIGKGALIGFFTGAAITIINVLFSEIWQGIDPDMNQKLMESTIRNLEAMDLPKDQKQLMIDSAAQGMREEQNIFSQIFWSIPMYGVLNLLTGMIGAKTLASKETQNNAAE
jgi:ABC-type transport system involved in multi-copper enzyme maturation permease subunit